MGETLGYNPNETNQDSVASEPKAEDGKDESLDGKKAETKSAILKELELTRDLSQDLSDLNILLHQRAGNHPEQEEMEEIRQKFEEWHNVRFKPDKFTYDNLVSYGPGKEVTLDYLLKDPKHYREVQQEVVNILSSIRSGNPIKRLMQMGLTASREEYVKAAVRALGHEQGLNIDVGKVWNDLQGAPDSYDLKDYVIKT